jgi:hypothetical protein
MPHPPDPKKSTGSRSAILYGSYEKMEYSLQSSPG